MSDDSKGPNSEGQRALNSSAMTSSEAGQAEIAAASKSKLICQICNASLQSLRSYHQRYRICDVCMNKSSVDISGVPHRFCQQCGRFQDVELFNGNNRSCRERLQKHAERRRRAIAEKAKDRTRRNSDLNRSHSAPYGAGHYAAPHGYAPHPGHGSYMHPPPEYHYPAGPLKMHPHHLAPYGHESPESSNTSLAMHGPMYSNSFDSRASQMYRQLSGQLPGGTDIHGLLGQLQHLLGTIEGGQQAQAYYQQPSAPQYTSSYPISRPMPARPGHLEINRLLAALGIAS